MPVKRILRYSLLETLHGPRSRTEGAQTPMSIAHSSSRRSFLRNASIAAAVAPILTESHFARAAALQTAQHGQQVYTFGVNHPLPADTVLINANENPLGPCKAACEAMTNILKAGGRYDIYDLNGKFVKTYAEQNGLKEKYVSVYSGSTEPLHYTVLAFTSPARGLVVADPSYEAPIMAASVTKAKIERVRLNEALGHDIKKMVAAAPNAGVIYICNPNNPTGTITSRADILWALENKPKGTILLVDEAYIHLSDAESVMDQVAADKDIVVLRTFSKIYGMAGIRLGIAAGRPDLLAKIAAFGGFNSVPVTALAAANASLNEATLVPERKKLTASTRNDTLTWLKANGYKPLGDPQSNCFMIDTGRKARTVMAEMEKRGVIIGRSWPIWPLAVRISVGTPAEMAKFKTAFKQTMDTVPAATMAELHEPAASHHTPLSSIG
jgi:histidinol-phosphate aminotransferase